MKIYNDKRGAAVFAIALVPALLLIAVGMLAAMYFTGSGLFSAASTPSTTVQVQGGTLASCQVEDTTFTYNDLDGFVIGTDPASTAYLSAGTKGPSVGTTVADDGTLTVSPGDLLEIVVGENSATYFSEVVKHTVPCSGTDSLSLTEAKIKAGGAPTITVINDDGATVNTDAAHESMSASSTYTALLKLRAPANQCSSKHGSVVAVEYDNTFFSTVESSLGTSTDAIYAAHNSTGNCVAGTCDQWVTFNYPSELCDNDRDEFTLTFTTTSTQPTEDTNPAIHWLPRDYDVDQDTGEAILVIYDESNNAIWDDANANTSVTYSVA
jgi:hypothetical protein